MALQSMAATRHTSRAGREVAAGQIECRARDVLGLKLGQDQEQLTGHLAPLEPLGTD
jgi:hypothetical protein